jgi:hypothetical protein
VQYDFGKATPSGFARTGIVNTPPTILLNALSNLRANYVREKSRLREYISKLNRLPSFTRDNAGPDILFEADYNHEGGTTCERCSEERIVARQPRRQDVAVHYGIIVSANRVMRCRSERSRQCGAGRRPVLRDGGGRSHEQLSLSRHPRHLRLC